MRSEVGSGRRSRQGCSKTSEANPGIGVRKGDESSGTREYHKKDNNKGEREKEKEGQGRDDRHLAKQVAMRR